VLVCPDCQSAPDLTADLDHCRQCGSVRLVRRLGEVECRACGFVVPPDGGPVELPGGGAVERPAGGGPVELPDAAPAPAGLGGAPGLAEEVSQALERLFGRNDTKPPASAVTP
jgi:hypothetical protein